MEQRFQNYQQALDFLYGQLPMFQKQGKKALKPGLANIKALLTKMNNPERSFPCVHLAGTNGKGSTSHMIAAILQASGLKVGLYTSPHYADFRERVKIDGSLIEKEAILAFLNEYYHAIQEVQPSYFELTVALAFDYFAKQKVDVAVIETGLGGLLDSTNVLQPLLSVITNIAYDHQDVLGDTLELIAYQKAGIIKSEAPVVIGETHPETKDVFLKVAKEKAAPITFADQNLKVNQLDTLSDQLLLQVKTGSDIWMRMLVLDTSGAYQIKNVTTALAAALQLKDHFKITDESILNGLSQMRHLTYFIGRWQILAKAPIIITDAGHNEDGIQNAMQQLRSYTYQQLHMVIGFSKEKDHQKMLSLLPKHAKYYFAKPNVPRGLSTEILLPIAAKKNRIGNAFANVESAIQAAREAANPQDLIYIGGSSFVVAEALEYFAKQ